MRHTQRRGFTLVELLAVMALIMFLVGIVLYASRGAMAKADYTATQTLLQKHLAALDEYRVQKGAYPDYGASPVDINETAAYKDVSNGVARYLPDDDRTYVDAWGSGIRYVRASNYLMYLYSWGPNGVDESGLGDDLRTDRQF